MDVPSGTAKIWSTLRWTSVVELWVRTLGSNEKGTDMYLKGVFEYIIRRV